MRNCTTFGKALIGQKFVFAVATREALRKRCGLDLLLKIDDGLAFALRQFCQVKVAPDEPVIFVNDGPPPRML